MSLLRSGFTTGTCAQAAAKASAMMLVTRKFLEWVEVETPSRVKLQLPLIDPEIGDDYAKCGVVKDAGDDPDITHGAKIYVEVRFSEKQGVTIKGGEGVGIVTKPGLAIPVGGYAINPTPREMILREVSQLLPEDQGLEVTIWVPNGKELAKRTFNPKLGILGGISIIGTTGIVEPKSIDAYKTSLSLQLDVLRATGYRKATLVLGYVGERYCKSVLGLPDDSIIKIGDYVGFMLEQCVKKGMEEVLLIGHIGKLVKVANSQFNTHNRYGDHRIDTIAHYAMLWGAKRESIKEILKETTAEATIKILKENGLMGIFNQIAQEVVSRANEFLKEKLKMRCIILSLAGETLGSHPKGKNIP
jgi:cobalt-precorrin-5B (C1)-methyltransferase